MGVGRFTVKQRIGAAPAGAAPRVSRVDAECGLCQGESGSGASLDVPWSRCLTGKCACHGDMGGVAASRPGASVQRRWDRPV